MKDAAFFTLFLKDRFSQMESAVFWFYLFCFSKGHYFRISYMFLKSCGSQLDVLSLPCALSAPILTANLEVRGR